MHMSMFVSLDFRLCELLNKGGESGVFVESMSGSHAKCKCSVVASGEINICKL